MNKTIIIIHGSKEHIGRYEHFIQHLESNDINVVADDFFNHGENLKGMVHDFSFDKMLNSALDIIDKAYRLYPKSGKIILVHSMGSFIVKYITYEDCSPYLTPDDNSFESIGLDNEEIEFFKWFYIK